MSNPLAVITSGPASAPIDSVRRITNFATGEIGFHIASHLLLQGFEVVLFRGEGATFAKQAVGSRLCVFSTNEDLANQLDALSKARRHEVRAVFHAAALSDYSVANVSAGSTPLVHSSKIASDFSQLTITLKPAPKLLPHLRTWFPKALVVGWKYELDGSQTDAIKSAQAQLQNHFTDLSIVNGTAFGAGFGMLSLQNPCVFFSDKAELANSLALQAAEFAINS